MRHGRGALRRLGWAIPSMAIIAAALPAVASAGRLGANGLIAAGWGPTDAPVSTSLAVFSVTGTSRVLYDCGVSCYPEPTWSPDGRSLIYRGIDPNTGNYALYLGDASGSSARRITPPSVGSTGGVRPFYGSPAWAPMGTAFAYVNPDGVWLADRPEGPRRRILADPTASGLTWSPDGSRIALSSARSGDRDIWTMSAGGGNLRRLTSGPESDESPSWSPDGTRILWTRFPLSGWEHSQLWTMRPDGSDGKRLRYEAVDDPHRAEIDATWSPDGTTIAVHRMEFAIHELWLMNADGSQLRFLSGHGYGVDWQRINRPPAAAFTYSPRAPRLGERVSFTSTSRDPDGPLAATGWDLDGDGAFDDGAGQTASYVYRQPGRYRAAVRVRDADGAVNVADAAVTVSGRPLR